jgi:hypothetical protein
MQTNPTSEAASVLRHRITRLALGSSLLVTVGLPSSSQAQVCFRGHPTPRCRGFTVLEFTAGARLNPQATGIDPGFSDQNRFYISWSTGYLHNLGDWSAIGATFMLAADDDGNRYGPVLRYRSWLGPTWSIDFAPGLIVGGEDNVPGRRFPSPIFNLAINWGDRIGLDLGLERVRRESGSGTGWDSHIGLRFGTWPALLATLGLSVLGAATYN